jgi:uncharacterized membrane protein
MVEVKGDILVSADHDTVWRALGDIGNIAAYNPGLKSSHYLDDERGEGASRRCVVSENVVLDERVVAWEEGRSYTLELFNTTAFAPWGEVVVSFEVSESDPEHTRVEQTISFSLKGGPLGRLVAPLMRGQVENAVRANLSGLKKFVEATP